MGKASIVICSAFFIVSLTFGCFSLYVIRQYEKSLDVITAQKQEIAKLKVTLNDHTRYAR